MSDTKAMLGPTEAGSKPAPVECPACSTPCAATLTFCGNCGARIASPLLRVGSVVGSYRLLSLLGEGGMGLVYLAEHTRLGRKVALKMLRPEMARDAEMVRRFFAEARAVNKILHPNIVEVTDFVEDVRGDNYIIMELLAGVSLDKVIAAGVPPLSRSLPIAIQIASALGAVHDAGIVHRDLKPENVFLRERTNQRDVVKLLDFGIAKLMDGVNGTPVSRTAAGMIVGTPSYMSIEQAGGKDVNHLTDIYSFGVVLYEMVTGRLPYQATGFFELAMQHSSGTPDRPSTVAGLPHVVPPTLEELILECLAKDRADRPQSMRVIEERLRAISDEDVIELDVMEIPSGRHQVVTPAPAVPTLAPVVVTTAPAVVTTAPAVTMSSSAVSNLSGSTERMLAAPRSRRLLWVGGGVLALAASVAALLWSRSGAHRSSVPALARPPAPPTVQIGFDSDPPGAEVFRKGDSSPLGTTPFTQTLPASAERSTFVFQLRGHGTLERDVTLSRDSNLAVILALAPAPEPTPGAVPAVATAPPPRSSRSKPRERTSKPARAPKPGAGGLDKGGVIDAFGD